MIHNLRETYIKYFITLEAKAVFESFKVLQKHSVFKFLDSLLTLLLPFIIVSIPHKVFE